jgi:hypothetical protein
MAASKTEVLAPEDVFNEDAPAAESDKDVSKTNNIKNALMKRRVLDDLLEARRLERGLRDYDFDLDD